ncbi:MAG: 16S rRNA (guanine1207-N2)-methyltransferase, partial [Pseudohongiellaceae bacterium]
GYQVELNDFDSSNFVAQSFDGVFFRVSKEKPVVHHCINQAARLLKSEGKLFISGYKKEGAKTYIDKAAKLLGTIDDKCLGGKTSMIASIICDDINEACLLDDSQYPQTIKISVDDELELISKPGVYGWKKIDRGSAFLVEYLPQLLETIAVPKRVVDLGCGFGYLSLMLNKQLQAQGVNAVINASDNNVAAVNCCQQNFTVNHIQGQVSLDDCGAQLTGDADLVICNPPFHQGFDVDASLTDKFLRSAQRVLKKGGHAFFVVNAFIPLDSKARGLFESIEHVANNNSFKLLLLKK